ncbi:MAG TPA: inorganic phosphate transporter [Desulfobacteraceae bacterium]|nr:inorganic phosphate transporter [Desulfobacteraceae bacterium]|tara:strand:+ start:1207 stop:2148 length:942 start_codon:yes stop_codon:yes gene_type:complete
MLSLLGGIFLGWSLGANDASNVFGTAVSSRMLRFRTAAILASVFVVTGAVLSGQAGIETLKSLTTIRLDQAVVSSVAAALTVTIMTVVGLPVSTSQAVVGAILGIGLLNNNLNISGLGKVVTCWIGTPVGGAFIAIVLYHLMAFVFNRMNLNLIKSDILLRLLLILSGSYGAYALGANNVANVTAVFVGAGLLTVFSAALIGGLSIAAGILTYSRPVMETVGKKLVRLDPFSALVVVTAMGITVHFYTLVGVPVSTSQAVVGAVLGVGIVKGTNTVSTRTLMNIFLAWCLTPVVSCILTLAIHFITHLEYVPG